MNDASLTRAGLSPRITIDAERWPLVIVRFVGDYSDAQFDAYLAELTEVNKRGKRVMIYDATHSGVLKASQRQKKAAWMKQHADEHRRNTLGIAFVLPSALLRGALTAIFWIQPLASPHAVVKDLAEAKQKAREWLEASGLRDLKP